LISRSEVDSAQANFDSASAQLDASGAQEQALGSTIRSAEAQLASARAQEQAVGSGVRSAEAQLDVAEAQQKQAEANVRQKQAALDQALVDLEHTYIRSPVDGVVISRNVDVGQTVAASLAAPTLFTIAQDLTQMQIDTNVDESDIGRIEQGQRATFTVDSFPGERFSGAVSQVRKAAKVVQNVVTYNVVIGVGNPGKRLLPGMTTTIRIAVAARPDALKVPNAALRFRPDGDDAEPAGAVEPPPDGVRGRGVTRVLSLEELRADLTRTLVLTAQQQQPFLVEVSAHHAHLTQEHVEMLYGTGHQLTKHTDLSQPGQFACKEQVTLVGPKGRIERVRVLGPARKYTQVEIAMTEQFKLGVHPPIRESGDIADTPGCTLEGAAGSVQLDRGVICALRHVHMTPEDALRYGVRDKSIVRVRIDGDRELIFGDVLIRVDATFALAMHIDTDEANAANVKNGAKGFIEGIQSE